MRDEFDPPEKRIEKFWKHTFKMANEETMSLKDLILPLARIKRLMKVEEGVRMVASEVPILFSKIAEKFIEELTLRAWINTEENKRRILQKSDISVAVKTSEMYDFLIYVVPRNDISTAFDRMLNNKLVVDPKIFHNNRNVFDDRYVEDRGLNKDDMYNTGGRNQNNLDYKRDEYSSRTPTQNVDNQYEDV